jgi:hypothetical protein
MTALTTLKIAVWAPIPNARQRRAARVNVGFFTKARTAYRRSFVKMLMPRTHSARNASTGSTRLARKAGTAPAAAATASKVTATPPSTCGSARDQGEAESNRQTKRRQRDRLPQDVSDDPLSRRTQSGTHPNFVRALCDIERHNAVEPNRGDNKRQ